jgi:hypothetical protein
MNFSEFALKDFIIEGAVPSIKAVRERIKIITSLNEKPKTDPVFEIQRLLRISGYKIKNTSYDAKGNAYIELAFSSDIKDAMKYLENLDNLPTEVEIKDNKIFVHA